MTVAERASHLTPIPASWAADREAEADYMAAVVDAIVNHPRSLQKAIGPSEIGTPCARKIAYKLLGVEERPQKPNWRATVGTGAHMWMEETFDRANEQWALEQGTPGVERYLIEERVHVGDHLDGTPITGSCDLYDRLTRTVIDHKNVGPTQLKKYRVQGPGGQYKTQANLYGLGWLRAGFPVEHVAISFLPRNGELDEAYWWSEPFDPVIAAQALQRLHGIETAIATLGAQAPTVLPTADDYCFGCPFYAPGSKDLSTGCPGDSASIRRDEASANNQLDGLLPVGK